MTVTGFGHEQWSRPCTAQKRTPASCATDGGGTEGLGQKAGGAFLLIDPPSTSLARSVQQVADGGTVRTRLLRSYRAGVPPSARVLPSAHSTPIEAVHRRRPREASTHNVCIVPFPPRITLTMHLRRKLAWGADRGLPQKNQGPRKSLIRE